MKVNYAIIRLGSYITVCEICDASGGGTDRPRLRPTGYANIYYRYIYVLSMNLLISISIKNTQFLYWLPKSVTYEYTYTNKYIIILFNTGGRNVYGAALEDT